MMKEKAENIDREIIQLACEKCELNRCNGFHCSESSIRAISDVLELNISDEILRVSSGFRGGGGGYGDRCGILETGIIIISYLYGRTDPDACTDGYSYLVRLLHKRFMERLGSIYCRDLLPKALEETAPDGNCSPVYKKATEIVMTLLLEAKELIKVIPEDELGK